MLKIKHILCLLLGIFVTNSQLDSQLLDNNKTKQKPHFIGEVNTEYEEHFAIAVDELSQMINDEIPISFKRGVFLIENAYYKGELNWNRFCSDIDDIVNKLKPIAEQHSHKGTNLSKNWAVFTYMSDSIPENDYKPYSYDFDTFVDDYNSESLLVTNLLRKGKGNCVSMPFLYKILANEIGAESYLTTAPMHYFIKIKDESGKWYNHEVTTGSFSRTSFIIESFGVTDRALQSGLYMKPLNEKESLTELLKQLICYYEKRTGKYYGDIVLKAIENGLTARPTSTLLLSKIDALSYRMFLFCLINNIDQTKLTYESLKHYPILSILNTQIGNLKDEVEEIGFTKFSEERYNKLFTEVMLYKKSLDKKEDEK
ncbi:MAG: hypothetical protein WC121_01920 [Candidatus Kapaibacterium sp.]